MRTLGDQGFYVDNRKRIQLGFPVVLEESRIWLREGFSFRGINRLVPRPSQYYGWDYYFPYRQQAAECVQVQHPPERCIAVRGGMNGCALEVTLRHGVYTFYHDANGENMHWVANAEHASAGSKPMHIGMTMQSNVLWSECLRRR